LTTGKRRKIICWNYFYFISVQSQKDVLKWCTTNVNEQEKCEEMAHNVDLQFSQFGKLGMVVKCIRVSVWLSDICIFYQILCFCVKFCIDQ
jgi:hypothetical protein